MEIVVVSVLPETARIALDAFDRFGNADRKIQHPRHRDGRLPHRQWRGQTRSCLLQARQKFARLVLVGQERGQRRGVDEHQASSYRLSRNALSAGWPFAGLPLARRYRQNWTPRSTKDGLPCSRSSSWASAACTASVRPIFFSAATLRASASVSGFLMWKAMARSSRPYRVSVYNRWDTQKEVVLVAACQSKPLSAWNLSRQSGRSRHVTGWLWLIVYEPLLPSPSPGRWFHRGRRG